MMNKKKENKGFTLVELIVVLVILAILAAILVPALLGYIDRAKGQQIVLNARSCYTAAQAELSSMYGKSEAVSKVTDTAHKDMILKTADVPGSDLIIGVEAATADLTDTTRHKNYTVKYVFYQENGQKIWFDGTSWVESKPSTTGISTFLIKGDAANDANPSTGE